MYIVTRLTPKLQFLANEIVRENMKINNAPIHPTIFLDDYLCYRLCPTRVNLETL